MAAIGETDRVVICNWCNHKNEAGKLIVDEHYIMCEKCYGNAEIGYSHSKFTGKGKMDYCGGVYEGDFVNDRPYGKGKYTWKDGPTLEGEFRSKGEGVLDIGFPDKGKLTWKDGGVYIGDVSGAYRTGRGKMSYADGGLYEGEWACGEEQGKGKMTFASGNVYEGDWDEGHFHGKGKYTWADGGVYEGDWVEGKRTGKGKHTYADGDIVEGIWEDGELVEESEPSGGFTGKGKETFEDGSVYEGDWVNGNPHGKGKLTFDDGNVIYEGGFVDGVFHGKGKTTWTDNGDFHEGNYVNGDKHGPGKLTYADGRVYTGDFTDGERTGKGKMTYPNGKVEEGNWKDGKFLGGSGSPARQTKPAVGIVVEVAQGDKSYGKLIKDRLMALASRSGKFTEAMGFEAFLNKELPKEMAQRDAQMKRGGTYYEPVARLAKRFGIPYACLVMVETDNDYGRISAVIGDANDETSLQVMNVESQGSKISNESLDNFISTVITYLSR